VQLSTLVSREVLYTDLRRTKQFLTIYSREGCVRRAVKTPTQRYSGLSGGLRYSGGLLKTGVLDF
ncbi:hypothetical protein, partial [Morganella morganii]|uniref:hypothetical protein n=1 Tax=Morganella morganii TaxID=582 RepID=UPI0019D8ECCA